MNKPITLLWDKNNEKIITINQDLYPNLSFFKQKYKDNTIVIRLPIFNEELIQKYSILLERTINSIKDKSLSDFFFSFSLFMSNSYYTKEEQQELSLVFFDLINLLKIKYFSSLEIEIKLNNLTNLQEELYYKLVEFFDIEYS